MTDEDFMRRALDLAEATIGLASPNPQVGCVLVRDGEVLGEGAHLYDNFDHAEIVALKQTRAAGLDPRGSTAYVTLEPCSHHGRTGPCADALIASRVGRCVIATHDANPAVSGRGIARLKEAGIEVLVGVLHEEAQAINNAFAFSIRRGRPFVTLKAALSVDGMLAPAPQLRIGKRPFMLTGPEARAEVQQLRHAADALISGIGTVLADDPQLTDRSGRPRRRPLMRVILDSVLRLPITARLLHPVEGDLWVFCSEHASLEREAALQSVGAKVTRVKSNDHGLDLAEILGYLRQEQIISVLLEAGSALNAAFLRAKRVDRAVLYYAETEIGRDSVPFAGDFLSSFTLQLTLLRMQTREIGKDVCISGMIHDPWA